MEPLRVHRDETAPAFGVAEEYYGLLPQSAMGDRELPSSACKLLAAIYLSMSLRQTRPICSCPRSELAFLCGWDGEHAERRVRWNLRFLIDRGHVEVYRDNTIVGGPRVIRPTARLRTGRMTLPFKRVEGKTAQAGPQNHNPKTPEAAAPLPATPEDDRTAAEFVAKIKGRARPPADPPSTSK